MSRAPGFQTCAVLLAGIGVLSLIGTLHAHHSFSMFDHDETQSILTGTVTAFEWTNPHAYIEVDVPDEKGAIKHWSVEMGSPSILHAERLEIQRSQSRRQGHRQPQPAAKRASPAGC